MNVSFTGKIIAVEPVQQGLNQQGQPWVSQKFVIEELNQQYPSRVVFQVFGSDKLQLFNIINGEILTVHIGFKAKQSPKDNRWYNTIDCWKVERFGTAQPVQQPTMQQQPSVASQMNNQNAVGYVNPQPQQQIPPAPQGGQLPF